MFYNTIRLVQEQHIKFKTWITTYGHSIDVMKFIRNINEENYKYIDGRLMDMIMTELFSNDRGIIQVPKIRDSDVNCYFENLKYLIDSLSDIYLKAPHHDILLKPLHDPKSRTDSYNSDNTNKTNE